MAGIMMNDARPPATRVLRRDRARSWLLVVELEEAGHRGLLVGQAVGEVARVVAGAQHEVVEEGAGRTGVLKILGQHLQGRPGMDNE